MAIRGFACYTSMIAQILFVGIARLRDDIALPLAGRSEFYGPQLSLSALCGVASNVRGCCVRVFSHRASQDGRGLCRPDRVGEKPWYAGAGLMRFVSREEAAYGLREQAASCRRLATRAITARGSSALTAVADYFDADARRIDPLSERL